MDAISQSLISSVIVSNISDAITSAVMSTTAMQNLSDTSTSTTTQKNTGLSILEIAIVAIVVCGGIIVYLSYKGGKSVKEIVTSKYFIIGICLIVAIIVAYYIYKYMTTSS